MDCLITGSSGLLGRCLTPLLRARGDRMRLLDLEPPEIDGDAPADEFVRADMRDAARVDAAARDVEVIYHLAAAQRMKPQFARLSEREIYAMNLSGVENVLRAAERRRVRKVVFISSSGIYGVPQTVPCREDHPTLPLGAYGRSKLAAEKLCREAITRGLDVTVLRPMSLFGPRMTGVFVLLFEWVRTSQPVMMLGRGTNRVQMISATDVAEACIRAAVIPESSGAFLNLGSDPSSVPTVDGQVRALIEHAGSDSSIVHIPAALLRNAARLLTVFRLSPIVPEHYLLADSTFLLDISRARTVLGWEPQHSNTELMNDAYDWYVDHTDTFRPQPHPLLKVLNAVTRPRRRATHRRVQATGRKEPADRAGGEGTGNRGMRQVRGESRPCR